MAFSLKAPDTFRAKVEIPLPGGSVEPVEMDFKHRTVAQLAEWREGLQGKKNLEVVLSCVSGWGLTDEFSPANVELLLNNYHGAAHVIARTYVNELKALRLGN